MSNRPWSRGSWRSQCVSRSGVCPGQGPGADLRGVSSTWSRSCSQRPQSTSCREAAAGSSTGRSARPRTSPDSEPITSSARLARAVPRVANSLLGGSAFQHGSRSLSDEASKQNRWWEPGRPRHGVRWRGPFATTGSSPWGPPSAAGSTSAAGCGAGAAAPHTAPPARRWTGPRAPAPAGRRREGGFSTSSRASPTRRRGTVNDLVLTAVSQVQLAHCCSAVLRRR